jgi:polyphosphate:AMP phosphotransferase
MLEFVDLSKKMSRAEYQQVFPELEVRLGACQRAARARGVPVVIVFESWDAAGKGKIINRSAQVLDPRGFKVKPILPPDQNESFHPSMWRFWNSLPAAGDFGIFDGSWYARVLGDRMEGLLPEASWQQAYEEIRQFERQLTDAGAVLVKFWLHIDKKEQKSRLKRLEKDPVTAWKVGPAEWQRHEQYDQWLAAVERMLEETGAPHAPWTVVEAMQGRFARVKVFDAIVRAVEGEIERRKAAPAAMSQPMPEPADAILDDVTVLDQVDVSLSMERDEYEKELDKLQKRLFELEHRLHLARVPAAIVYEGWDAAGKGGNIKRLTRGLDPRGYEVVPVGPPSDVEKAQHYLWRFWRDVPKAGHITIFDRSWYGRVLVERVEGFATVEEWTRAYREINEFEQQLADFGTVIVKFWLQIDRQEQLDRFNARKVDANKQWKITDEDWRNRDKWKQYRVAVVDMLHHTSTTYAPWTILEANCKLFARIKALRTVAEALERAL